MRSDGQDTPLAQQACSFAFNRHPSKARAIDVSDLVMPRQPFVHIRVVGRQQVDDAVVLAHLARQEQLSLSLESLAQVVVKLWKGVDVRLHAPKAADLQPLFSKILHERARTTVAEHATDLTFEHLRIS